MPASTVKITNGNIVMPSGKTVDGVDVSVAVPAAQSAADAAQTDATSALAIAGAAAPKTTTITAGTGLTGGGDLSTGRTLACDFGTGAGKVCQGNDSRLSDARTPTAHASSHKGDGTDAILPSVITESTSARTLALADMDDIVRCTTTCTVTVPANATVAFPIGAAIAITGPGVVTIAAAGGVTINPPYGGTLVGAGAHARMTLVKVDTNEWDLWGQTAAA